jgi:serine/threonine-protein kinase ATR
MATERNAGDSHTLIWQEVKERAKPVLANCFDEHFPSPELWYEARVNFTNTCAIWSIIGYVIGIGDRHGENDTGALTYG